MKEGIRAHVGEEEEKRKWNFSFGIRGILGISYEGEDLTVPFMINKSNG